jgi:KaiC/GvpD/RAD55 family RecA-like ATPase
MNLQKQQLFLEYCITSGDLFSKVNAILKESYFDPQIINAASFIKSYYEKYKSPPTSDQIFAETKIKLNQRKELSKAEIDYASNEIEAFCKNKAIEYAIYSSPKLLEEGKFSEIEKRIRDAITVGLHKNVGLDYFDNPEERLRRSEMNNKPISTGWIELDELLNGGLLRKELTIFAAASGVGKSLMMSNLTRNLLKQKLNGIYITFELSDDVVAKRFDSMFSGIGQSEIFKQMSKVAVEVEKEGENSGRLFVKRMPESTTNANIVRGYLKEFQMTTGITPDFIVFDYMDIMTSNQQISAENMFVKDKYIAEEIRSIGNDFDCIIVTASQLNRSSHETDLSDLGHAQIAGGISKINTADNLIAIIQDDKMRSMKQYMLKLLKTRSSSGVGSYINLDIDPVSLIISSKNNTNNQLVLNKKSTNNKPPKPGRSLIDIMNV